MTGSWLLVAVVAQAVVLSAVMAGAWAVQQKTGNSGWIDAIWTFGVGATGILFALLSPWGGLGLQNVLVAAFAGAWSLRLGLHIAHRTTVKTDDPRYGELIRAWGGDARRQMFWLLQKQAVVSIPLAATILIAAHAPAAGWRWQDVAACLVFAAGLIGEAVADMQLRRFAADPRNRGKVCDRGLWSWSRHPNYFFEWVTWVAYPLIAIDLGGAYPWGWLALAGPACMYWLLAHVSGIPPLEQHMLRSRGNAYQAYQRRVSAFFPVPPATVHRGSP